MEKKIVCIEAFSEGKKDDERQNQDSMYIGENFVAVIDGVSHKSSVKVIEDGKEKEIKIADIIAKAIRKMDSSRFGKEASFEEAVEFINFYIKTYLEHHGMADQVGKMEATAVIYSKHYNQIWIVGDCRAIYDDKLIENPLRIDQVYMDIRNKIINELLDQGYTEESLIKKDISRIIISNPEMLPEYIKSEDAIDRIEEFRRKTIREALHDCGFTEEQIEGEDLIPKYYNPRNLQKDLKNNPQMGTFGYAVFNGEETAIPNCKVEELPENVQTITLFSDGFATDVFNKGIPSAIGQMRKRANRDPLSRGENPSTHVAVATNRERKREQTIQRIDDLTAVRFKIEKVKKQEHGDNAGVEER